MHVLWHWRAGAFFISSLPPNANAQLLLQQRAAQEVLTTLKEHPDAWTRVDTILEYSSNQQTKYFALQILEQVIKTRWKVLPRAQCEGKR
jgi:hypothetical protein